MQKAETSVIPDQNPKKKVLLTKLVEISIDEKNMVYVNWPVDKKEICITSLCEALKLVCNYQPKIIEPPKPNFMDFLCGQKH